MRLVRFSDPNGIRYGVLEGDSVRPLRKSPYAEIALTGEHLARERVRLLAPCEPSKIVALGLNYRDHAKEFGREVPAEPLIFLKPSTSVIGPDDDIVYPTMSRRVDYEAELGVVISRRAKDVSPDRAQDFILGYTCVNDVTARDLQKQDGQFTRAKGFDTFCPLGPWIETDLPDPGHLTVEAYVDGQRRQHGNTRDMVFDIPILVSFISRVMTLLPGDVIATGTPAGIGPLAPGEVVEIRVEGVGALRNPVVKV